MKHRMLRVVQRLFQYQVLLTGEPLEFRGTEVECHGNKTFMQISRCKKDGTAPDPQGHTESHTLPPLAPSCHLGNLASVAPPGPKPRNLVRLSLCIF